MDKMPLFDSFDAINATRVADSLSLALLRRKRLGIGITKACNRATTD